MYYSVNISQRKSIKKLILSVLFFIIISIALFFINKKYFSHRTADVLIQAGHEGRRTGATGAESKYGKEIEWTVIVADEATKILREAGISVIRTGAKIKVSRVKLAIAIHFDGSTKSCASGASIGYPIDGYKPLASRWKKEYSKIFPYKWMRDNFTRNLRKYYGYKYVFEKDGFLLLELGELSCKKQALWLKPRLKKIGHLIAFFISKELNKDGVSKPKF